MSPTIGSEPVETTRIKIIWFYQKKKHWGRIYCQQPDQVVLIQQELEQFFMVLTELHQNLQSLGACWVWVCAVAELDKVLLGDSCLWKNSYVQRVEGSGPNHERLLSRTKRTYRPEPETKGDLQKATEAFRGLQESFTGPHETFRGPQKTFRGLQENFWGLEETFRGPKEMFRGPQDTFRGLWETFRGLWEILRRSQESFKCLWKIFRGSQETFREPK